MTEPSTAPTATGQLLTLLGLTGFAISQPLLSVLGQDPIWFSFRDADRVDIIVFAIVVAFAPPLVLWAVGTLLGRLSPTAGRWAHWVTVAGLLVLALLPLGRSGPLARPAAIVVACLTAAALTYLYIRRPTVQLWTRYTAVLPALALLSFVFAS